MLALQDTAALVTVIAAERKELLASRAERPRRPRGQRRGRGSSGAAAASADASSAEVDLLYTLSCCGPVTKEGGPVQHIY